MDKEVSRTSDAEFLEGLDHVLNALRKLPGIVATAHIKNRVTRAFYVYFFASDSSEARSSMKHLLNAGLKVGSVYTDYELAYMEETREFIDPRRYVVYGDLTDDPSLFAARIAG